MNNEWDDYQKVKSRIEKARAVYTRMNSLFKCHELTINTKISLLQSLLMCLFYGVESWTLTEATTKKLESFETWLYRRILTISWTAHITNIKVPRKIKKEREVTHTHSEDKKASVSGTSHEKRTEILLIAVHTTGKSTWKEKSWATENLMAEKF